jgi:uncharacterized protein Yka (UPF0111/DUF47 family)
MAKDRIIEALGEHQLLLPRLVAGALAANDRVKYLLTLLQSARAAADGSGGLSNLRDERLASGVDAPELDRVVSDSSREQGSDGWYRVPGAQALARRAIGETRTMLEPLRSAGLAAAAELDERVAVVVAGLEVRGDLIFAGAVEHLTAGRRADGDSLHMIVMDAHRELNALEARIASESLDGARVHDVAPGDHGLIKAFMAGVRSTERLRFDHPGLGTVATRTGPALVIQNDLGETDAHVVVIRVSGLVVTITYTDIHLARLLFFQELLSAWGMDWDDTRSRTDSAIESGLYHLASGRFMAHDQDELNGFLEHLGSRLVFMIDWNRARKRLRRLVGRNTAIELLRWAAEQGFGHIAFLRAGADGLVYDALEFAGGRMAHAGERLQDVLGQEAAASYLRSVLRVCAEGLLSGKMMSLVQDEVRAELTGYLRSAREEILTLVLRHAELSAEIAEGARDALERAIAGDEQRCHDAATTARRAEHDADTLVSEARAAAASAPELEPFLALLEAADDIADCAEEATFYATLLPAGQPSEHVRPQVRRIAQLVLAAAREYLRAVQLSIELRRGGPREEMDAFLAAAHQAVGLERETDRAQRAIHQALVAQSKDYGAALFVIVELTRAFEETADALMHSAQLLRERALARVVGSEAVARRATAGRTVAGRPLGAVASKHAYLLGDHSVAIPPVEVIGAKAHGLARMAGAGLRVPEAVVLQTGFGRSLRGEPGDMERLRDVLEGAVGVLQARTGLRLGSSRRPLLLSVRSGAPASMPGMLETVMDVGMCDITATGLIALTGNPRLAWDSYRRFVESYAAVVAGCSREPFERADRLQLEQAGVQTPRELTASALRELTHTHLDRYQACSGHALPQDPMDQLVAAVQAVLTSWDAPKARDYRRIHTIPDELGTAVILQRMVFGNAGGMSGSGVGFTRDPALGDRQLYMDFLLDAQGEDVVGGRHTVEGVSELATIAPDALKEIEQLCSKLEAEFGDAQEFEVTVQEGEVFVLQTRTAKRTPWAALRIAIDLVHEGLISPATALERLDPLDLESVRRVRVGGSDGATALCRAIPASVGVASGPLALDREPALHRCSYGPTPPLRM